MRFGPRAITIVNAVLLIAASSTSVLATGANADSRGLMGKARFIRSAGSRVPNYGLQWALSGKNRKNFPTARRKPIDLSVHGMRGRTEKRSGGGSHLSKRDAERGPRLSGRELFSIRTTALSTVPLLSVAAFHELKNPGEGRPLDFDRREDVACCDEVGEALRFYWIMWHCRRLQGDYVHRQQCICCNVERHLSSLVGDSMYFASSEK